MTRQRDTAGRRRPIGLALGFVLAFAAAGCSYRDSGAPGATGTPYRPYVVGQPYTISGKTYYPKEDFDYDRTGIASWYGSDFHGRRTANGETYDMNAMTAAHTTLPMPTIVRVTNIENGRSVVLRVNDRGPFVDDRIIDLSRAAADQLGMREKGVARVRVQVVKEASLRLKREAERRVAAYEPPQETVEYVPPPAAQPVRSYDLPRQEAAAPTRPVGPPRQLHRDPDPSGLGNLAPGGRTPGPPGATGRYYVQAGSFTERDRAERVRAALADLGPARISEVWVGDSLYFRVRVGPLGDAAASDRVRGRMIERGYADARVVTD
jgi:rare lipoprotein A